MVRKALELKPDDGYIMDSLAWILFKNGKVDEGPSVCGKGAGASEVRSHYAEHMATSSSRRMTKPARPRLTVNPCK